jgi:hypothetical protein
MSLPMISGAFPSLQGRISNNFYDLPPLSHRNYGLGGSSDHDSPFWRAIKPGIAGQSKITAFVQERHTQDIRPRPTFHR